MSDMNYEAMSDNEIIACINNHDQAAMEFMLKKHSNIVKRETRTLYLIGAEMEDLSQEGMIGLFKAIRDYEPTQGAAFTTFAKLCVSRQLMTAIQSSNRKKHMPLNGYISIYGTEDNNKGVLDDMEAEQNQTNPEQMMLEKEKEDVLLARIQKELSPLEKEVLQCFLDGLSYADISAHLNRSEKSVANALGRIRKKLSCP